MTVSNRTERAEAWTGWAVVYANCANVQLTLYKSKRDAERDGLDDSGDKLIRVKVEAVRGR